MAVSCILSHEKANSKKGRMMTMPLDTHEALRRVFGYAFVGGQSIIDSLMPHLERNLSRVDEIKSPKFARLLKTTKEKLKDQHELMGIALEYGEKNLFEKLLPWTIDVIGSSGILGPRMYVEHFREYWAMWGQTGETVAQALVKGHGDAPVAFTPATVFYYPSNQCPTWDKSLELMLGDGISYKEAAHVVLLREKIPKEKRAAIAKQVLEQGLKAYEDSTGADYNAVRREFLETLRWYFPAIHKEGSYQYPLVYTIFERMAMGHINLHHCLLSGKLSPIVPYLTHEISEHIPPPIELRARMKDDERRFRKMVECYFDLNMDRKEGALDREKEEKKLKDPFGLRIVVRELAHIGTLIKTMKKYQPEEGVTYFDREAEQTVKDYIISAKEGRGYRSLHLPFHFNSILHELQLRDWGMDYEAENTPRQAHEGAYTTAKHEFILEKTTLRQRRFLAAVFDFTSVPNSKYLR